MKKLAAILSLFLCALPAFAHAENMVTATLVSDSGSIAAGKNIKLGVLLSAPPGWHTYYKEPGDAGLATELIWQLPENFASGDIDWPPYMVLKEGSLSVNAYSGKTLLPVTISVPQNLPAATYHFAVKATWLACNEICIPETQTLSLDLPAGDGAASADAALFAPAPPVKETPVVEIFAILGAALLGGLVLNIMPCVLPVLSLKALSLTQKSGRSVAHTIPHGLAYTLGILLSFAALAGVLISFQHAGETVGWGYQMQSPLFVTFLIYLLFLVGLSLSGLFHLPVLLGGVAVGETGSLRASFLTGILATLVATPCTAPFMASAVGVALTLPPAQAMAVFLALGFGLALPFLLISIFPGLLRILPKPGAWMERFKELLAFPMYGAVIWLLWVLGLQKGAGMVAAALAGLLLIVFYLWLRRGVYQKITAPLLILLVLAFSFLWLHRAQVEIVSVPYSKTALADLRAQGKAVYVDATAAWCITCQLNRQRALETEATQAAFKAHDVTLMIADWTSKNSEVTEFLQEFGFDGVPLNVFYPAHNGAPVVLPQLLDEETVITAVTR